MDVIATSTAVDALLDFAEARFMDPADHIWARNKLLELAHCKSYMSEPVTEHEEAECTNEELTVSNETNEADIETLLNAYTDAAAQNGIDCSSADTRDRLCCAAMDVLLPRPGEVRFVFNSIYEEEGPEAACNYLYRLSCDGAYVHEAAVARDIKWNTPTTWGDLEITINRSKPEKDPRAIAALAAPAVTANEDVSSDVANVTYPACQLCLENEGYTGRSAASTHGAHPARQNLRIAHVPIDGTNAEPWGLQYSPYSYYEEHCIVINPEHVPMHIDRITFGRLLNFVDLFPQYFIGSNADLPIVGGSILNHDHFQAGRHVFPLEYATIEKTFDLEAYPHVTCSVIRWPITTLRLESTDRDDLLDCAAHVLEVWRGYNDETAGVFAETDSVPHNTITPIARRIDDTEGGDPHYVLNLCLRCNITSDEHPLGVFHPHAHLHHIKRENIGLIEAMGLAILPGRLARELDTVEKLLVEGALRQAYEADEATAKHADWALEVAAAHPEISADNVHEIVQAEVGHVFEQVLECAGVLHGEALSRFLEQL